MALHSLNPYIRFAKKTTDFKVSKEYRLCYDCRIFYVQSGKGRIITTDQIFEMTDDSAVYLPGGTKYSLDFSGEGTTVITLNFDLYDTFSHIENSLSTPAYENYEEEKILKYEFPSEFSKPSIFSNIGISQHLTKITTLFFNQPAYYREMASGTLKFLLVELIGKSKSAGNAAIFDKVRQYIRLNYADSSLSNKSIAAYFGYHPYYLANIIKQSTGKSLHCHISDYRISVSEDLLLTTEDDITSISWKCGFSSVSYFIKFFKERHGCTPLKYRKLYRSY